MEWYFQNPLSVLMPQDVSSNTKGGDIPDASHLDEILEHFTFTHYELLRMNPSFIDMINKFSEAKSDNFSPDTVENSLDEANFRVRSAESILELLLCGDPSIPGDDIPKKRLHSYINQTILNFSSFHAGFSAAFKILLHLQKTILQQNFCTVGAGTITDASLIEVKKITVSELYYSLMDIPLKENGHYQAIMKNFW